MGASLLRRYASPSWHALGSQIIERVPETLSSRFQMSTPLSSSSYLSLLPLSSLPSSSFPLHQCRFRIWATHIPPPHQNEPPNDSPPTSTSQSQPPPPRARLCDCVRLAGACL